jgi:hypothetical protein
LIVLRLRQRSCFSQVEPSTLQPNKKYALPRACPLQEFYEANKEKPLVLLKWLAVQASCALPNNLPKVRALMEHPAFTITTPNCCYSLFLGFARSVNFHAADGSGYEFIGDSVIKVGGSGWGMLVLRRLWACVSLPHLQQGLCRMICRHSW